VHPTLSDLKPFAEPEGFSDRLVYFKRFNADFTEEIRRSIAHPWLPILPGGMQTSWPYALKRTYVADAKSGL
jgi:hypothetical protein